MADATHPDDTSRMSAADASHDKMLTRKELIERLGLPEKVLAVFEKQRCRHE